MMNGTITVKSSVGAGSVFNVYFPEVKFMDNFEDIDTAMSVDSYSELIDPDPEIQSQSSLQNISGFELPAEVKEYLTTEVMLKWNDVKDGMMIDEIIEFAEEIGEIGKTNNLLKLYTFSAELFQSADTFNVTRINKLLEKFPAIVNELT